MLFQLQDSKNVYAVLFTLFSWRNRLTFEVRCFPAGLKCRPLLIPLFVSLNKLEAVPTLCTDDFSSQTRFGLAQKVLGDIAQSHVTCQILKTHTTSSGVLTNILPQLNWEWLNLFHSYNFKNKDFLIRSILKDKDKTNFSSFEIL